MTKVAIEVSEGTLKDLVVRYLEDDLGLQGIDKDDVKIEVKSKQNFKSEWEVAEYRATYIKVKA